MKRFRYVVEYLNRLFEIKVEDDEDMVSVDLEADEYEIHYVNNKGRDKLEISLPVFHFEINDGSSIEEYLDDVSVMFLFGRVLAVSEVEKQVAFK